MVTRKTPAARIAFVAAFLVLVLALVPAAFAGKPGGAAGKPGHGGTGGSGSLTLVLKNSPDGLAHWGQDVTFNVSSTVSSPYVEVDCSQSGAFVYMASAGFFAGYLWGQDFTLKSGAWTSGAADCTATLYSMNASGTSRTNLAAITFHVYA